LYACACVVRRTEHWRDPSFFGHPFIWCQFHENGGIMDMHGEMGPIATKMAKAMTDAPTMEQRMVGGGAADAF
jgi:hypothetical protein